MYKILLYLLLFLSVNTVAQEWAPIGAAWYYTLIDPFAPPGQQSSKFEVTGDTLIQGKLCSKIEEQFAFTNDRPNVEFTYIENDTVFFFDTIFAEFQILYDFNANSGDFWYIKTKDSYPVPGDIDTVKITVNSTDFITINSVSLKRMFVTYEYFLDWTGSTPAHDGVIVERLGDLTLMFNYYPFDGGVIVDGNYSDGLRCYDDIFLGHYEAPGTNGYCEFVVGLYKSHSAEFNLYPNPTKNLIWIDGQGSNYSIYSIDGRMIQCGQLIEGTPINVEFLARGLYIIKVETSEGQIGQKNFIKD